MGACKKFFSLFPELFKSIICTDLILTSLAANQMKSLVINPTCQHFPKKELFSSILKILSPFFGRMEGFWF